MSAKCEIQLTHIVDFAMDQLGAADSANVQSHIDLRCEKCIERLASVQGMADEAELEPTTERLLAQPLLDTRMVQPRMAGVRGAATLSRRRVFEAEGRICIDIQQLESDTGGSSLEGQVLVRGGNMSEVANSVVVLGRNGDSVVETNVDALGDFSIADVPGGLYDLTVAFANAEVTIEGIEI